jgi:hypothetical protein
MFLYGTNKVHHRLEKSLQIDLELNQGGVFSAIALPPKIYFSHLCI